MPSYVVTGASRGIGLEFVHQLSAIPDNEVFALVRDKAAALAVPSSPLKSDLGNVHVLEADVTNCKALKAAAAKVAEVTGGGLDVLINNAAAINGENDWRSLTDFEGEDEVLDQEFDYTFKVNVMGVIYATNSFLPLLRKGSTKKVVTISSAGGDRDFVYNTNLAGMTAYGASKAAANMIVTKFAVQLRDEGFIFIALSPGLVDTSATAPEKKSSSKKNEWVFEVMENMKKVMPNFQGMSTPKSSVEKQLKVISESTVKDNGAFIQILKTSE